MSPIYNIMTKMILIGNYMIPECEYTYIIPLFHHPPLNVPCLGGEVYANLE